MKLISLLVLFITLLSAEKVTIGAGPYIQSQPYTDVKDIVVPSPVIFFDNSLFYIRWSRAGLYFMGDKNDDYAWGLSLTIQPRPYGYEASDSTILEGMQQRKNSLEAGVALSFKRGDAYVESMLLTDVLGRSEAWIFKTEVGYSWHVGDLSLYPSLLVIYQSADFIDYYYGVKAKEANVNRPYYKPSSGVDYAAQTYISYPLTKELDIFVNIRADRLSKQVTSSPIVEDGYIYSGLVSLIYTFSY
jgi:outer membrane protein